ncbi:hypothetical protein GOP47_0019971 [Adiantum capillus-veneris]|uniref:Protein kinase domain-containing protein n=1 Tax=Adiantum capillus-veneris TaxID=13818 RepID=A0A9D4ZA56_ADICA|nr:hypothetical protein GOP47_0019971 [Adiantum capillus-veneris]
MEQKAEKRKYPLISSMYTLMEEVGQGASAVVYKAKCIPFNEIVAIKVLDMDRCNNSLDDIRREAQTMSLINHPNVLSAYCSFVVDHSLWVVMPYMSGGSCLHIMKSAYSDGFEEPVIATVLKESLKALEYLHHHGHIHRDVKAGNILIGEYGAIKLGDFGVSACMFDTGDRQRSRNTFVGTPCWMAPEVLEQVNGYDFKADIWSFGITALELAHGHAPFSKYPPMKVLLMTLQNAPPGLDYERDKRFSKSFKEMIAMCLVKNPSKRPTAEKLMRHSFFKHAKSCEYIVRTVLDGLAPLGQRFRDLKVKDAERLAQKKMPFDLKEERSQNEYKRGVSSWNFDIEDLKAQAASMQDDDGCFGGKEEPDLTDAHSKGLPGIQSSFSQDSLEEANPSGPPIHPISIEPTADVGGRVSIRQSGRLPSSLEFKSEELVKALEVPEDELVQQELKAMDLIGRDHGASEVPEPHGRDDRGESKQSVKVPQKLEGRDLRLEKTQQEGRRASSGPLVSEYVLAGYRNRDDDRDYERLPSRAIDDSFRTRSNHRDRAFSGPLSSCGAPLDHRFLNGLPGVSRPLTGLKDSSEKGLYVQKKGRFSVTSADVELTEDQAPSAVTRRSASTQALAQLSHSFSGSTIPTTAVLPCLQNLLNHTVSQQDLLSSLISSISRGEPFQAQRASDFSSQRPGACSSDSLEVEISSDREHELLQQVAELQSRLTGLVEELQTLKLRNISLERQLNAIYNKEEEERIRREDEAKEDR